MDRKRPDLPRNCGHCPGCMFSRNPTKTTQVEMTTTNSAMPSSSSASAASGSIVGGWACPACTKINPPSVSRCVVCSTPRNKTIPAKPKRVRRTARPAGKTEEPKKEGNESEKPTVETEETKSKKNEVKEPPSETPSETPAGNSESTQPTESAESNEPTESVEPKEPKEPVKPTEPAEPVKPTEPVESEASEIFADANLRIFLSSSK